jgi:hypothetical protein
MKRIGIIPLAVLASTPGATTAQDRLRFSIDDPVRVAAPSFGLRQQIASLVALDSVAVWVKIPRPSDQPIEGLPGARWEYDGQDSVLVLPRSLVQLEVRGERGSAVDGVMGGLLAGAYFGYRAFPPQPVEGVCLEQERAGMWGGRLSGRNRRVQCMNFQEGPVIAFGVGFALLGGIIGHQIKRLGWRKVGPDDVRVRFGPLRDGRWRVGASVGF